MTKRKEEIKARQLQQCFQVTYQYPVIFTYKLFKQDNNSFCDFLNQSYIEGEEKRILFVLDDGMLQYYPLLKKEIAAYISVKTSVKLMPFLIIPGGEEVKNASYYLKGILSAINDSSIDRHSFVCAVGGGAVLDLSGYAAATAHRGICHIRIPTTVLSQNDSGVGVKNGINYFGKKNFLGTFVPPFVVFNDFYFLHTLDDRNWRSGIAEAVKVALIKDVIFFEWIEENAVKLSNRDATIIEYLVYRCAELHLQHISSGDPFESGSSRPLDFGHWSAHKLEQLSDFSLTHGEAVAIGIALDSLYSMHIGWMGIKETERILSLLKSLKFGLFHPSLEDTSLLDGLAEFREHLGGELTIMLLKGIGNGENIHSIDKDVMIHCIRFLKEYELNKAVIS